MSIRPGPRNDKLCGGRPMAPTMNRPTMGNPAPIAVYSAVSRSAISPVSALSSRQQPVCLLELCLGGNPGCKISRQISPCPVAPKGPRRSKSIGAADPRERSLFRQRDWPLLIGCDFGPLDIDLREELPPMGSGTKRGDDSNRKRLHAP